MSYDEAIDALRDEEVAPPPLTRIVRAQRWTGDADLPGRLLKIRVGASAAIAIFGFMSMALMEFVTIELGTLRFNGYQSGILPGRAVAVALPVVMLVITPCLVGRRDLASQMLARAIWWSTLIIGLLIAVWGAPEYAPSAVAIAIGAAAALLQAGGRGLGLSSAAFKPAAFREQLLVALVMAFADAQTLLFSGILQLGIGKVGWTLAIAAERAGPALAAALVMGIAVAGIYRLRTWALFLNIIANVAIAYLAMSGALGVTIPVALALTTTAGIQLFLPVPILAAALGDKNRERRPMYGLGPLVARASIVIMVACSIGYAVFSPSRSGRPGWIERGGHAFVRGAPTLGSQPFYSRDGECGGRGHHWGDNLDDADLTDGSFRRSDFRGASLRRVKATGADFEQSCFTDASLVNADLRRSNLSFAQFAGADLTGADLREANLVGARWVADLSGADLSRALVGPFVPRGRVTGATCPDGELAEPDSGCAGRWGRADFADLEAAGFLDATFRRADCNDGDGCATDCRLPVVVVPSWCHSRHLKIDERRLVKLADGSYFSSGLVAYFVFTPETKIEVTAPKCGTVTYERAR